MQRFNLKFTHAIPLQMFTRHRLGLLAAIGLVVLMSWTHAELRRILAELLELGLVDADQDDQGTIRYAPAHQLNEGTALACPICGAGMRRTEGCFTCPDCGTLLGCT